MREKNCFPLLRQYKWALREGEVISQYVRVDISPAIHRVQPGIRRHDLHVVLYVSSHEEVLEACDEMFSQRGTRAKEAKIPSRKETEGKEVKHIQTFPGLPPRDKFAVQCAHSPSTTRPANHRAAISCTLTCACMQGLGPQAIWFYGGISVYSLESRASKKIKTQKTKQNYYGPFPQSPRPAHPTPTHLTACYLHRPPTTETGV